MPSETAHTFPKVTVVTAILILARGRARLIWNGNSNAMTKIFAHYLIRTENVSHSVQRRNPELQSDTDTREFAAQDLSDLDCKLTSTETTSARELHTAFPLTWPAPKTQQTIDSLGVQWHLTYGQPDFRTVERVNNVAIITNANHTNHTNHMHISMGADQP